MAKPTAEDLRRFSTNELLQRHTREEIKQAIREAREGITQARPGFVDRFKASFAPSPEAEADIYKRSGYKARPRGEDVVIDQPGGGYINVDPPGFDVGDIADVGGELPSIVLGAGGGLLAGLGGLATGPGALAAAAAGSAGGSAAGEYGRQQLAQYFGAEQPTDWGRVGTEAALGAAGEGVGKLLARPLRGLVSKARRTMRSGPAGLTGPEVPVQPEIAQTLDDLGQFDLRFGTQLEARAPLDVQTQSEMVGEFQQRIRESPGGGRRVRENIDKPFAQEVERGYEAMGRAQGIDPITQEQRLGVGSRLQEAATKTKTDPEFGRLATRRRRYEAFEELVDPNAEPDLSNTQKAIQEILKSKIMRRELVGTAGLEDLNKAIEAAQKIQTFDRLNLEREALNDQIDPKSWATPMAGGPQGLMKRLWTGLNDDWEAFLEAGGKKSTRPGADAPDPAPTIDLDIKTAQAARAVGETLTPNQIVRGMGGLQPSELKRIKGAMDVDRGMASAIGKLRGRPGMTIEEMLENVRGSEQGDSIFRAAGIESADDFMEAIRTKTFFQKFQAGTEAFERGATREQAEAARGQIGPLFERIENAGTVDDLQAIAREFEEARAAGIVDVEDLTVANDEIKKRYNSINRMEIEPKFLKELPEPGEVPPEWLDLGPEGRSYAQEVLDKIGTDSSDESVRHLSVIARELPTPAFGESPIDEFYHATYGGQLNASLLAKAMDLPGKSHVGTLGDVLLGKELRELYKDALDVDIYIHNAALKQRTREGVESMGALGRVRGDRPVIIVGNETASQRENIFRTILHEGTHALRAKKGRLSEGIGPVDPENYESYRALPFEESARRMTDHANKILTDHAKGEIALDGLISSPKGLLMRISDKAAADKPAGWRPEMGTKTPLYNDLAEFYTLITNLKDKEALKAGKAARSYASGLYKIDESSVVGRLFRNEETWSDIPARLTKGEGLTPEEIRGLKRYVGAEGVKEKGIDPSVRGQKAWTDLQSSVLEDLKKASIWRGARYAKTTPDQFVIDGEKLVRKLDNLKPGALDEIFGPVLADDLTRFANMVEGAQKSEKQFGNISGSGSNLASPFHMALLSKLFSGAPQTAIADILGRMAASTGGGLALGTRTGVDLLTGQTGWQRGLKARPRLLETLGRVGGLTTVQGAQGSTGAR